MTPTAPPSRHDGRPLRDQYARRLGRATVPGTATALPHVRPTSRTPCGSRWSTASEVCVRGLLVTAIATQDWPAARTTPRCPEDHHRDRFIHQPPPEWASETDIEENYIAHRWTDDGGIRRRTDRERGTPGRDQHLPGRRPVRDAERRDDRARQGGDLPARHLLRRGQCPEAGGRHRRGVRPLGQCGVA
jgi:hypothetical protein